MAFPNVNNPLLQDIGCGQAVGWHGMPCAEAVDAIASRPQRDIVPSVRRDPSPGSGESFPQPRRGALGVWITILEGDTICDRFPTDGEAAWR